MQRSKVTNDKFKSHYIKSKDGGFQGFRFKSEKSVKPWIKSEILQV